MDEKRSSGFVSLKALKGQAPRSAADIIAEIRRIYFRTSKQTIANDFAHAIELLKSLPDDETRDKAAVYMEGIAQMRHDWLKPGRGKSGGEARGKGKPKPRKP